MSYQPMMEFSNQPPVGNALRFATEEEAMASAENLFSRWTVPTGYHAKQSDDPVNYRWDADQGLVPFTVPDEIEEIENALDDLPDGRGLKIEDLDTA